MRARLRLKWFFILGVFIVIIAYGIWRVFDLVRGPEITISEPANGVITQPLVEIKGTAVRIAKLYINSRQIFTDEEGQFHEPLLLGEGYTILAVQAEDRFGRKIKRTIELVYRPAESTINN